VSASQAASLWLLPAPVGTERVMPPDDQPRDSGIWQQAFQAAARGDAPSPGGAQEAARMLALGNLALSPIEVASLSPGEHAVDVDLGQAAPGPSTPAGKAVSTAHTHGQDASTVARTAARWHSPDRADTSAADAAPVAEAALHGARVRVAGDGQAGHAAPGRSATLQRPDPAARPVVARPHAASARQAVASYAAAMSSAPAPSDRAADFSLSSRATTLPVRVHVQWRDRVADVWIGLHRQAFDQLPDIRAGIEDWVVSRGGVLGHVVCNGEALARVASSISFLGAP